MISLQDALTNGRGTWRSFTCPSHDDRSPSARVNAKTGKWVCMVCHAKGSISNFRIDVDDQLLMIKNALDHEERRTYQESWWDRFDSFRHPYWQSRFADEAIDLYRLGYDADKDKPCYPLWSDDGMIIGPVYRNLDGLGPKYRYPFGANTSELLFGIRELQQSSTLVLVEGAMDVVAVREAGCDAVGSYGSVLYNSQVSLLQRIGAQRVLVAYDDDFAGREGAVAAVRELSNAGILARQFSWDSHEKDLAEMAVDVRKNVLAKTLD